ncbi:MAG: VIT1/CCC1 transporter family protein [Actinobacteria bacterium]|nr:VIT1/CCC1 transporter family protein [Actinomycetota bacterium]
MFELLNGHVEGHRTGRAGWLRAAVLGANDGLVSTASLMVGVAASHASTGAVITAGVAGLAAGAMAMAAGEYVSVSSQVDVERADRTQEERELAADPDAELAELTGIYRDRGLPHDLAVQVALALHERDPLAAHLRDELGFFEHSAARPIQAAIASALSFLLGGLVPFLGMLGDGSTSRIGLVVVAALLGLAGAGVLGARVAGAGLLRPALRVVLGGGAAMLVTAAVGSAVQLSGG